MVGKILQQRLRSPDFLQQVYRAHYRALDVFGVAPTGGHPDPFEAGSLGSKGQPAREVQQRFFAQLSAEVSAGEFRFSEPLGGGRGPATPGEARNLLADWLVMTVLEKTLECLGQRQDSGCSFGQRAGDTPALLQHLRSSAPEGGWNRVLTVNYAPTFDHLSPKRLVVLLERHYLQLQIFTDLLHQLLNRKLLRSNSRSLAVAPRRVEQRLMAQLQELYLQRVDRWLLQPERLRPEPRQRPKAGKKTGKKAGKGAPAPASAGPPKALRPVRCGYRLLLLLRGSEEQCKQLQVSLQRFTLGQLALRFPRRGGTAELLPLEEQQGVELLGFQLRKHPRSRHLSILFDRHRLLRSLARQGLLKGKDDGEFRALSWTGILYRPAPELVNQVAHYFWALALHFSQADNGHEALCLVRHYGRMVAACSLAHKNRSSAQQQLETYGDRLTLRDGYGEVLGQWPLLQHPSQLNPRDSRWQLPPAKDEEDLLDQLRWWAGGRRHRPLQPPAPISGAGGAGNGLVALECPPEEENRPTPAPPPSPLPPVDFGAQEPTPTAPTFNLPLPPMDFEAEEPTPTAPLSRKGTRSAQPATAPPPLP